MEWTWSDFYGFINGYWNIEIRPGVELMLDELTQNWLDQSWVKSAQLTQMKTILIYIKIVLSQLLGQLLCAMWIGMWSSRTSQQPFPKFPCVLIFFLL